MGVHVTTQSRSQGILMALAAALVLLVPTLTSSVIAVMVERNHEQLVRLHCTGTPREGLTRSAGFPVRSAPPWTPTQ